MIWLRVNQLIWTPEDIRLALIDHSGVVWDKFYIYQGHRVNTPYIQIGTKRKNPPRLKLEKHPNAIKRAHHYKELLDSGQVDSQGEL